MCIRDSYTTDMEWIFKFTDKPGVVVECLSRWKGILSCEHEGKYTVVFDMTETTRFGIRNLLQISGFVALNKKKIKAQTDKVRIVTSTREQERVLKSGLRMTPHLVDFEVIKLESNLSDVNDAATSR